MIRSFPREWAAILCTLPDITNSNKCECDPPCEDCTCQRGMIWHTDATNAEKQTTL